jgi:acetoin:2,6-dichlorophenolindophenol oxidoreductase subunit beta
MSTQLEQAGGADTAGEATEMTYRQAVNAALADELAADERVLMLGEDVANDGGVFKTNEGLAERFPGRIVNTPICENTFVGLAAGMAVKGLRPVVEIMFSDFLPTAGDALVEELPRLRFMSGGQCSVPVTVRSMGGSAGGFGAQHSATGESWFMALPGLLLATAGTPAAAYGVLRAAIRHDDPVLVIEHKSLYMRKGPVLRGADGIAPIGRASIERRGERLTIVATLLMVERSLRAAEQLAAEGIDVEVIDLRWLRPLDIETVRESVERTGRLLIAEEQVHPGGWGATVISQLVQQGVALAAPPRTVSMPDDLIVGYAPALERAIVPGVEAIAEAARQLAAA